MTSGYRVPCACEGGGGVQGRSWGLGRRVGAGGGGDGRAREVARTTRARAHTGRPHAHTHSHTHLHQEARLVAKLPLKSVSVL